MNKPQINAGDRTNYYSGMLLSEKDMLNEQMYMNNHRYIGNKFLHGSGVVGGLTVVRVDEDMLSLETGFALDHLGREMVVTNPKLIRLDQINGYQEFVANGDARRAFLCMRYSEEKLTEEDICLTDEGEDTQHCKRIREGYEVYLTEKPLTDFGMTLEYFRGRDTVLYKDDAVTVVQRTPSFVGSGSRFTAQILFFGNIAGTDIELHLKENLSCLSFDGTEEFKADIKTVLKEKYDMANYEYSMDVYNVEDGTAELRVSPEHSYVVINGEKKELREGLFLSVPVTARDEYMELIRRFYIDHFESQMADMYTPDLYLAAIYVDRKEGGCAIDRIENVPFAQYSCSSFLTEGLIDHLIKDVRNLREEVRQSEANEGSRSIPVTQKPKVSSGEYVFNIALGAKEGERLISEEIVHGLGLGPVTVDVSLIDDMKQLHGAAGIFDEMPVKIDKAVLSDMSKGTFRIGLKVLEVTALPEIKMHWTAIMNPAERTDDDRQKRIRIVPDKLEMKTLQNYYLKAEADNLTGAVILWEVGSPNGGVVSRDGLYTAPDLPGVYEVSAFCQDAPEIKDTIFIIVRE